jgi:hypothetical protein
MSAPSSIKLQLVRLRDALPLSVQRWLNRAYFQFLMPKAERALWNQRLADVLACRDNTYLPRHQAAGQVAAGIMTMHNGLRIHAGSYYGWGSQRILELNKGCHEPQEERAFAQVLEHLPAGATMVELGAYWSFYSLWFATHLAEAKNWMVEPEAGNREKGQANFALNGKPGTFVQAYVGKQHRPDDAPPQISVDGLMAQYQIAHLNLLHSDIQGFELEMLHGAAQALAAKTIDHLFISTHSNALHQDCIAFLSAHHYLIRHDINLYATFSHDGLIVAQSPALPLLPSIELDRKH